MSSGTISAIVATIGIMITIAALLGSWKLSRNTQAVKLYRETAQAWEAKAKAQADEIESLKDRDSQKEQEIIALRTQVTVLQDTVTGKSALEALDIRTTEILDTIKRIERNIRGAVP